MWGFSIYFDARSGSNSTLVGRTYPQPASQHTLTRGLSGCHYRTGPLTHSSVFLSVAQASSMHHANLMSSSTRAKTVLSCARCGNSLYWTTERERSSIGHTDTPIAIHACMPRLPEHDCFRTGRYQLAAPIRSHQTSQCSAWDYAPCTSHRPCSDLTNS